MFFKKTARKIKNFLGKKKENKKKKKVIGTAFVLKEFNKGRENLILKNCIKMYVRGRPRNEDGCWWF